MNTKVQDFTKYLKSSEMGTFMMIDAKDLSIDHDYQRAPIVSKVQLISKNWSWPSCVVLSVALRENGDWYIYDGQHRFLAGVKRGITEFPCMVFEFKDRKAEASAWKEINSNRKLPSTVAAFKASLMAEDPVALLVNDLCASTNRKILDATSGRVLKALAKVQEFINRGKAKQLIHIWPLLDELAGAHPMQSSLIGGLVYIEANLKAGVSLMDPKWRDRTLQIGDEALLDAANKSSRLLGKGGNKAWAFGMMQILNKRIQEKNRLHLDD